MERLRRIIHRNDTPVGRGFDFGIQALILLSVIAFTLETIPDLSPPAYEILRWIEIVTVGIFTVEYILRLAVAESKLRFAFSFFGLIDLVAILPFYFAGGLVDLRSARALRFLRLFRILKLGRYNQAVQRFGRAFRLAREEMVLFFSVTLILLYLTAVGIYYFERHSQPEAFSSVPASLWWAVTTLTTVGYGDVYPITTGGRIFTFFVLMIGIGTVAVPSGLLATALTEVREEEEEQSAAGGGLRPLRPKTRGAKK